MYAVMGATGNTGGLLSEKLLARGEKVRAIGRSAERLAGLAKKGAELIVADATDAAALTKAFTGVRGVYAMIPPNIAASDVRAFQEKVADACAQAFENSGVNSAVVLSSVGADKALKTGPVVGLHNFEQKLNGVKNLNALYLRAGYFMENILVQPAIIKNMGIVGGPLRADLALPMIATRDIAPFAANALLNLDFRGKHAQELLGPRDLTYREVAMVLGKAIGNPGLAYTQLPPQQLKVAMVGMGMSSSMADLILEMADALNSGHMVALEPRSSANTSPTSLEQFVAERFVPAFKS